MNDAYYACLAAYLGLRSKDLAELGGFTDRFARDLLAGKASFQPDVIEALIDIQDDIEVMVDVMDNMETLTVFRTNEELRKTFKSWPARGQSVGGFVGPHRVAVIMAQQETDAPVVWVD